MSRKTRTQPAHVWVLELFERNKWNPIGTYYSRDDGRASLDWWKGREVNNSFRLRKYVREDPS